ncbi:hypothetical protein [Pontibacter mangrovi]|uniref:Uncharacterized protein n=1 Tax=Pontibacter mangrovi TaxID=2589816 RepID=A0A501VYY4_9BACT|nr:hypothetical protein [Pontibacter mangrovi]TPE39717.1 hypothetical protein FJM65_20750 [Pontibacter mangrovi]
MPKRKPSKPGLLTAAMLGTLGLAVGRLLLLGHPDSGSYVESHRQLPAPPVRLLPRRPPVWALGELAGLYEAAGRLPADSLRGSDWATLQKIDQRLNHIFYEAR